MLAGFFGLIWSFLLTGMVSRDLFDAVEELDPHQNLLDLPTAIKSPPFFLGYSYQLKNHGQGGLGRTAALGLPSAMTHRRKDRLDRVRAA